MFVYGALLATALDFTRVVVRSNRAPALGAESSNAELVVPLLRRWLPLSLLPQQISSKSWQLCQRPFLVPAKRSSSLVLLELRSTAHMSRLVVLPLLGLGPFGRRRLLDALGNVAFGLLRLHGHVMLR